MSEAAIAEGPRDASWLGLCTRQARVRWSLQRMARVHVLCHPFVAFDVCERHAVRGLDGEHACDQRWDRAGANVSGILRTKGGKVQSASWEKRFHGRWLNASPVTYCIYSALPRVGSSHGVSTRWAISCVKLEKDRLTYCLQAS